MAQDLDYEWEAYEKGWRGQPQPIKPDNQQLNGQIQQLTMKMNNAHERLCIEMRNRETIQRRNLTGIVPKKKVRRKKVSKSRTFTPLEHTNKRIEYIQNQISTYSRQIGRLKAQLNYNT